MYGAGYTDVHIRLPLTYVTMAIALLLAAVLVWNVWRRHQWWPVTIAVWVVALIVLRGIVPAAYQSLIVNPNQLSKEKQYISYNLASTKAAYGLNQIQQKPLATKEALTPQKLNDNSATLRNIRLWDPNTLVTSYRQLQELRKYYTFLDADVDRYTVNGVYRQTMLSPRELNMDQLPQQWVNQHITYTHGFGVAMSAVNQVTADGSPDFLVQDIPPVSSAPSLQITEPRIYFGELGTEYSLVNTKEAEFDYPGATGDVYTKGYSGSGGVPISSFLNRLAFAAKYGTIKFFTTSALKSDSRIIFRNDIRERIHAAAPFLGLDPDPYMVIADGKLYWIQDAYTRTTRYPVLHAAERLNYIRNSVKVVVDAYNGTMRFYVWDEQDPLLKAWRVGVPRPLHAAQRGAAGAARARALPRGPLRHPGRGVVHLPRGRARDPLQQGRPVADPGQRGAQRPGPHAGLLRDHATARRVEGGVPPHAAVRPDRASEHDQLARRAQRRAGVRQVTQLHLLQEHDGLRAEPGRGRDQPGSRDLLAADALGPAGLTGDHGQPARGADRGLAALRAAPLPAERPDAAAAAQAGRSSSTGRRP